MKAWRLMHVAGLIVFCGVLIGAAQQVTEQEFKALSQRVEVLEQRLGKLQQEVIVIQKHIARGVPRETSSVIDFSLLEGAQIIADDGQFLGVISTSPLTRNSIMNELGPYGSELSSKSIFNELGKYGSKISALSPFNELASKPPRIFKGEKFIAYLSVNRLKSPRVDTRLLIAWLKANE